MFEFHVSRAARQRYQLEETLFSFNGSIILPDVSAVRRFAQMMNAQRDLLNNPENAIYASQLNAMGLVDELLHDVVDQYRRLIDPQVMGRALDWLEVQVGDDRLNDTLLFFVDQFPPSKVYRDETSLTDYFYGSTDGVPHRQVVLEEMLLLWLANDNPAFMSCAELFDDRPLEKVTAYNQVVYLLEQFFEQQPPFGPDEQDLVTMLGYPARQAPDSLKGQLRFIAERWKPLIGKHMPRILQGLDFIAEEERVRLLGPGPAQAPDLSSLADAPEHFSQDTDWMSKLVLLAKNAYVWLYQLSRKYQREIRTLDQVPNEELAYLSQCGFNGLWLIGLWQRSEASKRIKQMMGNPDAIASAYSLYDYNVADELGGEGALAILRERAWDHCIRLASDMVPNHTGIDSRWMVEHPDWFLSLEQSPFPSYSFNGVDLMPQDGGVGIYLEDHYYDRSDAAVVFKRVDHHTGDTRYIYHGNDGTSMAWNDTAQLNYLKAEVREAIIQAILNVARRFPIIRFDAAMTLAKQHIQRLWFPQPGTGGDIPSRAEHGLTKRQFDRLIPREFWLDVVDRVAQEVPDTLLLAEAFWMMEGYFVRTLGMHRVYNSAFMHMLRDEDNADYRRVVKETLEFNPQILKRYVNFMNNPDEDTAIAQFGDGDKYFGVCTMMATLPGLPMFGHGQVEGYTEKYGMEYYRAYLDEMPNEGLVQRHQHQVFPLLHRRKLFAEVDHFLLYDFFSQSGAVNEDVFAYSNRYEGQRALVLYHNRFSDTRGWIHTSVAKGSEAENGSLEQWTLGQGLALPERSNAFVIFREQNTGMEYIRSCQQVHEQGLYFELKAYHALVLLDFWVVYDAPDQPFAHLTSLLGGSGVPDMYTALRELEYQSVHVPYRELVNAGMFHFLIEQKTKREAVRQMRSKYQDLLHGVQKYLELEGSTRKLLTTKTKEYRALLSLPEFSSAYPASRLPYYKMMCNQLQSGLSGKPDNWVVAFVWLFSHGLGQLADHKDRGGLSQAWIEDWLIGKIIKQVLADMGVTEEQVNDRFALIRTLLCNENWLVSPDGDVREIVRAWFGNPQVQSWLKVNRYEGIIWFDREAMYDLLWWSLVLSAVRVIVYEKEDIPQKVTAIYRKLENAKAAAAESDFQVNKLLAAL